MFGTSSPVSASINLGQVWPLGPVTWTIGGPFLGATVLFHGMRSSWVCQLRRRLQGQPW